MTSQIDFVCTLILTSSFFCPINQSIISLSSQLRTGCPNNFPLSHQHLRVNETFVFELRASDTTGEQVVACVGFERKFLGWVSRVDQLQFMTRLCNGKMEVAYVYEGKSKFSSHENYCHH